MMKNCELLYFTGTGNSKRILEIAGDILKKNGYTVNLSSITGKKAPSAELELLGFCFPVYSLALPRIALNFLKQLPPVAKTIDAFLFITGGDPDDASWSHIEGKKILESKGYRVVAADLFQMPNNWVPFMDTPSKKDAKTILAGSEKAVTDAMIKIISGESWTKALNIRKFGFLMSRSLYHMFRGLGVKHLWRMFKTNDNCNSCGICAKACPTGSIAMLKGKPKWSKGCEQCMRCIHICPKKAILQLDFLGKGSLRERYLEPHFKPLAE